MLFLILVLVGGFLLANQSPINSDLRTVVGSPFIAASISFIIGTIFLGMISWLTVGQIFPSWTLIIHSPWWVWLGGLLGSIYLTSNVLLFPKIGAIQTVILPVLGQIVMGTMIDSFGWFGVARVPMTLIRLIGIIVMTTGIIIAVVLPSLIDRDVRVTNERVQAGEKKTSLLGWQVWAVTIGFFAAIQQAINGHLGTLLQSPAQAAFISFGVGMLLIVLVAGIVDRRVPTITELRQTRFWNWAGGFLGGLFVFITVIVVPQIGAGMTIMMGLIGQIIGSILIQKFGWWHSMQSPIVIAQIVGVVVMLTGVLLIKIV